MRAVTTDFLRREEYCGLFRTPTLRNVALRKTFFHNGAMHSLSDAVRFYVERETRPERWYPRKADGASRNMTIARNGKGERLHRPALRPQGRRAQH